MSSSLIFTRIYVIIEYTRPCSILSSTLSGILNFDKKGVVYDDGAILISFEAINTLCSSYPLKVNIPVCKGVTVQDNISLGVFSAICHVITVFSSLEVSIEALLSPSIVILNCAGNSILIVLDSKLD